MPVDAGRSTQEEIALAVSDELVRLFKSQFGRGPTKARTWWCGADMLVTALEDTLAPVERRMVELGQHERLRETRLWFQYATVQEFCEPVERLTGRKVRAFVSGMDSMVDGLSTEVFLLHPAGSDAPSRTEAIEPG